MPAYFTSDIATPLFISYLFVADIPVWLQAFCGWRARCGPVVRNQVPNTCSMIETQQLAMNLDGCLQCASSFH